MKPMFLVLLAAASTSPMGQPPVVNTYAYSRDTIPGIPGSGTAEGPARDVLPTTYFIYVVVKKGTVPSATGVWIKGKYYAAALRRVDSPVLVDHDVAVPTGKRDTLVGKTPDHVYQVVLGEEKSWKARDDAARRAVRGHEVVVFLKAGRSTCYGKARTIKPLRPAAGM